MHRSIEPIQNEGKIVVEEGIEDSRRHNEGNSGEIIESQRERLRVARLRAGLGEAERE